MGQTLGDSFEQGWDMMDKARALRAQKRMQEGIRSVYEQNAMPTPEQAAVAQDYQAYNQDLANQDKQTFGVNATADSYAYGQAPRTAESVEIARAEGVAKVLAEAGDYQGAMQAQNAARVIRQQGVQSARQAGADQRAIESHAQQIKQGDLTMQRTQAQIKDEENGRLFDKEINQYLTETMQRNSPLEPTKLFELGAKYGQSPEAVGKAYLTKASVDEATAKAVREERLNKLYAASERGLDAMVELADPDPTDNEKPKAVKNKDGSFTIHYGGKPMQGMPMLPADNPAATLFAYVKGMYDRSPNAAAAALIAQEQAKANLAKTKSETAENQAKADEHRANAGYARAGKPGGGVGNAYKVEMSEVINAFGRPVTRKNGEPFMDPLTGRQQVNRDQPAEDRFLAWMDANGITNTDQGLLKYKALGLDKVVPAAKPAGKTMHAPQVGEKRLINGQNAIWDGKGWKAAK